MPRRRSRTVGVDELSLGGTKPPVGVTVGEMFTEMTEPLKLSSVEDNGGFDRRVRGTEINRPALALAGYFDHFSQRQIQILGMTELSYVSSLSERRRSEVFKKIASYEGLPCFVVARGRRPPPALKVAARNRAIPVAVSRRRTTDVIALLSDYLRDKFAPRIAFHGDLLDVYGVGILVLGDAAVGKSECALDLVARGHRIVADDLVFVRRRITGELVGDTKESIQEHIEIRGLGVLNVKELFGIRAIRKTKNVELIVKIELLDPGKEYDRTGLERRNANILGVEAPYLTIPVVPGKNISTLIEVAALDYLLKRYGYDAARVFDERLRSRIRENLPKEDRE
ncbi:MAG: HPr(Ser) kinase/phosphatase [Candidatus Zixiibacteriota bacterium]|jgi:HPr kinase/phosphorylase